MRLVYRTVMSKGRLQGITGCWRRGRHNGLGETMSLLPARPLIAGDWYLVAQVRDSPMPTRNTNAMRIVASLFLAGLCPSWSKTLSDR